jgi:uncharacterized membrane protein YhhN
VNPWLLTAIGLSGAAACEASAQTPRPRRFLGLKPLTTALLLLGAALAPSGPGKGLLLLGLGLSWVGDVCLLGAGSTAFLAGLGSFLLAHLAFAGALLTDVPLGWPPRWTVGFALVALALLRHLGPGLGSLRVPVLVYAAVLVGMALAAARAAAVLGTASSWWGLAGALCFVASDAILASDRFRGPHRGAQPVLLALYWAALACLVQTRYA